MYINYNSNNNHHKESHPRSPLQCCQVIHPLPYSFFQRQRRCQQEQQKRNRLRLAKQKLCRHNMLFWTFLCRLCMTMMWKYLISHFVENVNTPQWLFSFPVLQYSLLDFNSRKKYHSLMNWMRLARLSLTQANWLFKSRFCSHRCRHCLSSPMFYNVYCFLKWSWTQAKDVVW